MSTFLNHEKLRREIKGHALKQEPLAEQLNISVRHLRNLCSKDVNVSSDLLYRLSEVLQVPMDDLLTMREDQE